MGSSIIGKALSRNHLILFKPKQLPQTSKAYYFIIFIFLKKEKKKVKAVKHVVALFPRRTILKCHRMQA